eukprot:scaffold3804_cov381-Prasinococcus_capsulatus_cf.AAC.6
MRDRQEPRTILARWARPLHRRPACSPPHHCGAACGSCNTDVCCPVPAPVAAALTILIGTPLQRCKVSRPSPGWARTSTCQSHNTRSTWRCSLIRTLRGRGCGLLWSTARVGPNLVRFPKYLQLTCLVWSIFLVGHGTLRLAAIRHPNGSNGAWLCLVM